MSTGVYIYERKKINEEHPEFSVAVHVANDESLSFHAFKFPATASNDIKEKFLDEATEAVYKKLEEKTYGVVYEPHYHGD